MTQINLPLKRIISGGQTGADQGALAAAKELGLKTGGWAPRDYRTDDGPQRELLIGYGLLQHQDSAYPARTKLNVQQSDATFIFGQTKSAGCRLTISFCRELEKRYVFLYYPSEYRPPNVNKTFRGWLEMYNIKTLNVAGNRESTNPGIGAAVKDFLISALKDHVSP